ncbi:hypothetical protein MMC06_001651 [Schaereria dolodes]|nr:hypothetical protein [Schaereria dolodes]
MTKGLPIHRLAEYSKRKKSTNPTAIRVYCNKVDHIWNDHYLIKDSNGDLLPPPDLKVIKDIAAIMLPEFDYDSEADIDDSRAELDDLRFEKYADDFDDMPWDDESRRMEGPWRL